MTPKIFSFLVPVSLILVGFTKVEVRCEMVQGQGSQARPENITRTQASIETIPRSFFLHSLPVSLSHVLGPRSKRGRSIRRGENLQFQTRDPDGSSHFGYEIDSESYKSYREEKRDRSGRVIGIYGFVDPSGTLHQYEYEADENGYRSRPASPPTPSPKPRSSTSLSPFTFDSAGISIIGPIPRPFSDLMRDEDEGQEINEDEDFEPLNKSDLGDPRPQSTQSTHTSKYTN